jgi:cyclopropane fatty-acyl-phospholipid synthase-like methyltransferase
MHDEKFARVKDMVFSQARSVSEFPIQFKSELDWERNKKQINQLTRITPQGGRVLDLGCGWGHTTAMLAALRPDLKIMGIDLSRGPTWKEFEKEYGCKFQVGDALDLKIKGELDVVVSFGVMEHVTDDKKFLEEIHRVLRPGGLNILFNLPNRYSISEFSAGGLGIWRHERNYTREQIIQLFADEGFEVLETSRNDMIPAQVGRVHWVLEDAFNRAVHLLDRFDNLLSATSLNFFAQNFTVVSRSVRQ